MDKSEGSVTALQQELSRLLKLPISVQEAIDVDNILTLLARQIAATRQNANYIEQLNLVQNIAKKLVEERDIDQLAKSILEGANSLIPFTDGSIGLVNEGIITFPYAIGESAESVMNFKIPVGEGLTGWVVENKKPIRIEDTGKDERYRDQIGTTKSELDVPIIYNKKSIGVINIESTEFNAFSKDDERLLTTLAEYAAIAVKNAQLFHQMNALTSIAQRLSNIQDSKVVLEQILEVISELIQSPEVSVGILDRETDTLVFTLARGPSRSEVLEYTSGTDQGLAGWAVRTKKPVRVGDVTKDPRYYSQIGNTKSELDVPMLLYNEVIGVLNAESPNPNAFSEHDEYMMVALASQAALAVKHAELYEEVEKELEKVREKQLAAQKMAAIGDVAGNLVHQMNNDVGAIRVLANRIKRKAKNDYVQDKAHTIWGLANKVLGKFSDFRDRYKDEEMTPLDINRIIRTAVQDVVIPPKIKVVKDLDYNLAKSFGANVHLKEVFRNLVANAVEAMPEGGTLLIQSQQQGEKIVIHVRDSGAGISEENRSRIFDFGFSTKTEGKGLGYGLFWVKAYLNTIDGDIKLTETKLGRGTAFTVTLPVYLTEIQC